MAETKVQITVSPADILALINSLVSAAFDAYESLKQVMGEKPIPTWEQISSENAILQAKIDVELQDD